MLKSLFLLLGLCALACAGCDSSAHSLALPNLPTVTPTATAPIMIPTAAAGQALPYHYAITDLGETGQLNTLKLDGMNNFGEVIFQAPGGTDVPSGYLWVPAEPNGVGGALVDFNQILNDGFVNLSGVNQFGQVTGSREGTAFLWTPNVANGDGGTVTFLNAPGLLTVPVGINDYGQIAGTSDDYHTIFLWTPTKPHGVTGSMTYFPNARQVASNGNMLNNDGQIVFNLFQNNTLVLWTPSQPHGTTGTQTTIHPLPGDTQLSIITGLNDAGQLAGISSQATTHGRLDHAMLWTPTKPNGAIGAAEAVANVPAAVGSQAEALNARGAVIGEFATPNAPYFAQGGFAFLPTTPNSASGQFVNLGTLPGDNFSTALAVNNHAQVVGYSLRGAFFRQPFIWDAQHGMQAMRPLLRADPGIMFDTSYGMLLNDAGQIVLFGRIGEGDEHVFLLTPVA